jgi:hypothetical protein
MNEAWINGVDQSITSFTVGGNAQYLLNLTYTWTAGNNYEVKLTSSQGNTFLRTERAPTS